MWQYVLITPARDEAKFIRLTLSSVIGQTVRPLRWVIVSDGSTDGTDDVVERYAAEHSWIELVQMPKRSHRDFGGKVRAFNAGYEAVKHLDYEAIGSLDADVSFDPGYFEFLLQKLSANPSLGLVGTPFAEGRRQKYDYRFTSLDHVSGACQLFRRKCFEQIGGYVAVAGGGIDYLAVINCRMKGWATRTFTEKTIQHHRPMGTANCGVVAGCFRAGVKDYRFGNHPVWEIFRVLYQTTRPPLVIGGLSKLCGYLWALCLRYPRPISEDILRFTRREQMRRLRGVLGRLKSAGAGFDPA
jgi:glycosyltransferase involved in cell wall biosynthesis